MRYQPAQADFDVRLIAFSITAADNQPGPAGLPDIRFCKPGENLPVILSQPIHHILHGAEHRQR
jgi:hypothetical protein